MSARLGYWQLQEPLHTADSMQCSACLPPSLRCARACCAQLSVRLALVSPLPCRKPGVAAHATDADSAVVEVTAPTTGRPWASYNLTACVLDGTELTDDCRKQTCPDASTATSAGTPCALEGLEASTSYGVVVLAEKAGAGGKAVISPASQRVNFTTPLHE